MLAEMETTRRAGKVIGGHYASADLGRSFHAYAAGGAEDDHEGTRLEDAVARAPPGDVGHAALSVRPGRMWLPRYRPSQDSDLDSHRFILCTDDSHAGTLVNDGHMDRVVRHAISQGLPPMTALQMATINTR